MLTKTIGRALLTAVAMAGVTVAASAAHAGGDRMVFATMPGGTMYYTLGTGVSAMLTKKLDRKVTVQPHSGSSVYLPLIDAGEAQLGFSSSLDADAAFRGTDRKPLKNLRAVARVWALKVALMARESAGLKTVKDLKGKRVVVDFKGQVAMGKVIRAMLATGGLGPKDVKAVTVGNVRAGNEALIKGNVDVTFIAVGIPLVKQANSKIPGGVRYIDLAGGDISPATLGKHANGVYATDVKPAAHLPEVKAPIKTTAFDILLVTSAKTPAKDVKAVLAALSSEFKGLQKSYPPLRRGKVAGFASPTNTVPYHAGAVAFFKEKGMWSAANDKREASFAK